MAKDDNTKAATAPEIDVEKIKADLRAEFEAEKADAVKEVQDKLDEANAEIAKLKDEMESKVGGQSSEPLTDQNSVAVKLIGNRKVHTSQGPLNNDKPLILPESEAAILVKKGLVKTV